MSKIIIYPNNSVSIDDVETEWTDKDFLERGIETTRVALDFQKDSYKLNIDGNSYTIYYTLRSKSQVKRIKRRWNDKFGFKPNLKLYKKHKHIQKEKQ